MPYDFQTTALIPYVVVAVAYLCVMAFAKERRDYYAFLLVVAFCLMLGVRDTRKMSEWADPVWYSEILTNDVPAAAILATGGADYLLFFLVHGITSRLFNLSGAFFVLHLLYVPAIYLLYRLTRRIPGMFFLLAGWLLFVNSGLLLIANFFRQGQGALYFLVLTLAFTFSAGKRWARTVGAFALPFLHLSAGPLVPGLFMLRNRRFIKLYVLFFALFCIGLFTARQHFGFYSVYLEDPAGGDFKRDLWVKVIGTYLILAIGYYFTKHTERAEDDPIRQAQRALIGFLLPTAALLIFANSAPEIGTRFIYYSHAIAFAFLASAIANWRDGSLIVPSAVGLCLFGFITWTYPTVTILLKW